MRTYNNQEIETIRVYYSGTDTLQEGYALCYNQDQTIATSTTTDRKATLGMDVEKPATANLSAFAGLVAASSGGVVGPAFIDIIPPAKNKGRFVTANVKANATAYVTKLGPANASYALAAVPIDLTSAATADLSSSKQVALPVATADTSGAEANKTVRLL